MHQVKLAREGAVCQGLQRADVLRLAAAQLLEVCMNYKQGEATHDLGSDEVVATRMRWFSNG